jgi:hypothetical protein
MWTLVWVACGRDPDAPPPGEEVPLDLTEVLGPGEARAGVIEGEAPLFGGISAEARPGDVLLYNDRARFVVQGPRPGNWYFVEGGGVIDADVVRPEGQLGRDAVEEWGTMFGLGRILVPEQVTVVSDGSDGGSAIVRVTGYEGPLGLIEGSLELPGFIPELGLEVEVEYELPPDSFLLTVRSTARATDKIATLALGDVLIGAEEVLETWVPAKGFGEDDSAPRIWSGYHADQDDIAYVIAAPAGETLSVAGYELLSELTSMVLGFAPSVTLQPGESTTWTRYYGVGPDLATLSGAVLTARGEPVQQQEGQVTGPEGPLAGARVVIDVDGAPYTLALTGADGAWSATLPEGQVSTLAVGRGTGLHVDLPPGAAAGSPYAVESLQERGRQALAEGALPVPHLQGYGVGTPEAPSVLGQPARLVVRVSDGLPFTVRVSQSVPDLAEDPARVPPRPEYGYTALGWSRDGEIVLEVEPGFYGVSVHRGPRFERYQETLAVNLGQETVVQAELPLVVAPEGWLVADPHSHASPSSDGSITMEERLIVSAASGVQVHFGTDHDHLADYRPLLEPLGLQDVLVSVVADEVSPPLRGHFNIYPVTPEPGLPDNGAWLWWTEIPLSTEDMVDRLRARHGDSFVLQSNHPTDSGMAQVASWATGHVARADMWTDRIEAVEVLNSGDYDSFLAFWLDLVLRGRNVTPVGVSDSHSHTGGDIGFSFTWIHVGTDVASVTDEAIADAIRSGRVQPSRGPFLQASVMPGSTVAAGTELSVQALAPSWIQVDRLRLLRDGVVVEEVAGTEATFVLSPERDAVYTVEASGDSPMATVSSLTPWALLGPYRVDVEGNGFVPPLPDLVVGG